MADPKNSKEEMFLEQTRERISRDKVREVIEVQITNDKVDFDSVSQEALIVE